MTCRIVVVVNAAAAILGGIHGIPPPCRADPSSLSSSSSSSSSSLSSPSRSHPAISQLPRNAWNASLIHAHARAIHVRGGGSTGSSSSSGSGSTTGNFNFEGFPPGYDDDGPTAAAAGGGVGGGGRRLRRPRRPCDPNPPPSLEDLEEFAGRHVGAIDLVLDQIVGVHAGVVTDRYVPSRRWMWRRWRSTAFRTAGAAAGTHMLLALVTCVVLRRAVWGDWRVLSPPGMGTTTDGDPSAAAVRVLAAVHAIWTSMRGLTTLVLAFFVGQAYNHWTSFYVVSRTVQHRMDDVQLLLTSHAGRSRRTGAYTREAERFLNDVGSKLRAFHVLLWASQARRFRILLTDRGMSRMVSRGVLTAQEKEALDSQLHIPRTHKHMILLGWVLFQCKEARSRGVLHGGEGLEQALLDKACGLRTACSQLSNKVHGRMPLAYAHFVRILVDAFLLLAPVAQFGEMGILAVVSAGLLTFFYAGLLDLAFALLDPLSEEQYHHDDDSDDDGSCVQLDLSVLIRESTASSHRWRHAGSKLKW